MWGGDPQSLQVEFLKIDKGGRVPPCIARKLAWPLSAFLGMQNRDIEFAEEAWALFKDKRSHP